MKETKTSLALILGILGLVNISVLMAPDEVFESGLFYIVSFIATPIAAALGVYYLIAAAKVLRGMASASQSILVRVLWFDIGYSIVFFALWWITGGARMLPPESLVPVLVGEALYLGILFYLIAAIRGKKGLAVDSAVWHSKTHKMMLRRDKDRFEKK